MLVCVIVVHSVHVYTFHYTHNVQNVSIRQFLGAFCLHTEARLGDNDKLDAIDLSVIERCNIDVAAVMSCSAVLLRLLCLSFFAAAVMSLHYLHCAPLA